MIILRRSNGRHHVRRNKLGTWRAFSPDDPDDRLARGFGALEQLSEHRLAPGANLPLRAAHEVEVLTYVVEGSLTQIDSTGRGGVLEAGDFQRFAGYRGLRHRARNCSREHSARLFHLVLHVDGTAITALPEQIRMTSRERRGGLRLIASRDARDGSLRVAHDVALYSAVLELGQPLSHVLQPDRSAWLHVVRGQATLGELLLSEGDAVGIRCERTVSFTAGAVAEILLLDLGASIGDRAEVVREA